MDDPLSRERLIALVRRISSGEGTQNEITAWINTLEDNVPDPGVSDLIFWSDPELTAEEIVDRALAYEVVAFPPPGESHLFWAVRTGNVRIAEALLAQGSERDERGSDGKSLHELAEEAGNPALIALLARHQTG